MRPNATLDAVIGLRSAAFELLEATAHSDPSNGSLAATVDHLQVVANELGAVEQLLERELAPAPLHSELRRRRYWARATSSDGRLA